MKIILTISMLCIVSFQASAYELKGQYYCREGTLSYSPEVSFYGHKLTLRAYGQAIAVAEDATSDGKTIKLRIRGWYSEDKKMNEYAGFYGLSAPPALGNLLLERGAIYWEEKLNWYKCRSSE